MPNQRTSLSITDRYRAGMVGIRERAKGEAVRAWNAIDPDDLDGSYSLGMLVLSVETLQREAARLSSAYLLSYIGNELERSIGPPIVDARQVGESRSGGKLKQALRSPLVGVKVAIGEGEEPKTALANNRARLLRIVGLATDEAARESLRTGMNLSPFVAGWRRAIRGTCAACMAVADEVTKLPGESLEIHPDCQCVAEPVAVNDFDPKVGQRAELRAGKELINGGWVEIEDVVRGKVVKRDLERVMLNAGTDKKPRWIAGHGRDLFKPTTAPRRVVDKLAHGERAFVDSLTQKELQGIDAYKGYGYKTINGQLRAGKPGGETVRRIDAALERGSLGSETTLYRALHLPEGKGVGDTFQDLAFASTSKKRNVSSRFFRIGDKKRVLMRIKAKAGTKGGHLPGQNEEEFLLRRGTRFRLLKETLESGIRVFDVELA